LKRDLQVLLWRSSEAVIEIFQLAGLENVLVHCGRNPAETGQRLVAGREGYLSAAP
jgi:hypothetical protein